MIFYKGVLVSCLSDNYIPGTVAVDFNTALIWKDRISGNKHYGANKHIVHGRSVVIEVQYDGIIHDHTYFQMPGVTEHKRVNCWTSAAKDKAQINTPCKYRVLSEDEVNKLFKL